MVVLPPWTDGCLHDQASVGCIPWALRRQRSAGRPRSARLGSDWTSRSAESSRDAAAMTPREPQSREVRVWLVVFMYTDTNAESKSSREKKTSD